ncbi:MAG TPA: phosphate acyltransferase PlsX [Acidimicrobiales bacterium]
MARRVARPAGDALALLPVAVDAMGGDRAPDEIVAGARQVAEGTDITVVLVGRPGAMGDTGDLPCIPASEVIGMDDDPGQGVRRKKDSSLVRAAEAVRDGQAMAMVSAGNTGAAMASALLRMGRLPNVIRPAIATPIPNLHRTWPTVLLDSGANAECTSPMLVQFAQMGAAFAAKRYGVDRPRVALLSIGEEKSKGTPLEKETHAQLAAGAGGPGFDFVGNVEGRDFFDDSADVVVTDGFTGNVALKTMEGTLRFLIGALTEILSRPEVTEAADALYPHLLPLAANLDPDSTGGAMLLGVDGVCVISHGSSSAAAMVNAITAAHDLAVGGLVEALADSVTPVPVPDGGSAAAGA